MTSPLNYYDSRRFSDGIVNKVRCMHLNKEHPEAELSPLHFFWTQITIQECFPMRFDLTEVHTFLLSLDARGLCLARAPDVREGCRHICLSLSTCNQREESPEALPQPHDRVRRYPFILPVQSKPISKGTSDSASEQAQQFHNGNTMCLLPYFRVQPACLTL